METKQKDQHIWDFFSEITDKLRTRLRRQLTIPSFPIVPLREDSHEAEAYGYCVWNFDGDAKVNPTDKDLKEYKSYKVDRVEIQLRTNRGALRPPPDLMLALLHETAHAAAPGCYVRSGDTWQWEGHPSAFWHAFALILQAAQELDLFYVPSRKRVGKFKSCDAISAHDARQLDKCEAGTKRTLPESCCGRHVQERFRGHVIETRKAKSNLAPSTRRKQKRPKTKRTKMSLDFD